MATESWSMSLGELAAKMFKAYDTGPEYQKYATTLLARASLESARRTQQLVWATWVLAVPTICAALLFIKLGWRRE